VYALLALPGPGRGLFLTNFPAQGWLDFETLKGRTRGRPGDGPTCRGSTDGRSGARLHHQLRRRLSAGDRNGSLEAPVNHVFPAWDAMTGVSAALAE